MGDKVIKQHYVPQFYLDTFTSNGKLQCYDKKQKKYYGGAKRDLAEARYFYDPDKNITKRDEQIFDLALERVETRIAPIFKKIVNICNNSSNLYSALITTKTERVDLSLFICLQIYRTNKFRNIQHEMYDNFFSKLIQLIDEPDVHSNSQATKEKPYQIDDTINHLKVLFNEEFINAYSSFLLDSSWTFMANNTEIPFITSDSPICRIPRFYESWDGNETEIPFLNDQLELYFPLSPHVILKIFRKESHEYERLYKYRNKLIPLTNIDMVNMINLFQLYRSHERVFFNQNSKSLIEQYLKELPEAGKINYSV